MKSDLLLNKSRESSFLVLDDVRSDKYTLNGSLTLHGKVVLFFLFFDKRGNFGLILSPFIILRLLVLFPPLPLSPSPPVIYHLLLHIHKPVI